MFHTCKCLPVCCELKSYSVHSHVCCICSLQFVVCSLQFRYDVRLPTTVPALSCSFAYCCSSSLMFVCLPLFQFSHVRLPTAVPVPEVEGRAVGPLPPGARVDVVGADPEVDPAFALHHQRCTPSINITLTSCRHHNNFRVMCKP